jgi:hypothetical protein
LTSPWAFRDHPATAVTVTGTFDNWGETAKLEKKEGSRFEKTVELPESSEKIFYKASPSCSLRVR